MVVGTISWLSHTWKQINKVIFWFTPPSFQAPSHDTKKCPESSRRRKIGKRPSNRVQVVQFSEQIADQFDPIWSKLSQYNLNTAWILHHLWVTYFKRFCSIMPLFRRIFSEGGHREIDPGLWNWPGSMAIENHVHMDTNRPFSKAVLYFQISYRNIKSTHYIICLVTLGLKTAHCPKWRFSVSTLPLGVKGRV